MSKPSTRQELIDYCFRRLGAPVLEINVDDDQVDDLVDDTIQYFNERHYDGVQRVYLKYKISENDIKRGRARGGGNTLGITTSSTGDGGSVTTTGDSNWDDVIVRHTFDSDFTDSSPVGNTPTVQGSPDIVASPIKFGKSARFGINKYLYYGHNAAYNFTGEWTFETWIYIDSSPGGGALFSKSYAGSASNIFGLLVDSQDGTINFRWSNTDNTDHSSIYGTVLGSYTPGSIIQNWVHVAVTRRASDGSIHFFLNGTESANTSSSQVIDNNIPNESDRYLYLNYRAKTGDNRSTDAIYDDVRITAKERYTSNFTAPTSAFPTDGTLTTSTGGEVQNFEENSNYLTLPDSVIGIEKLFHFDNSFVTNSMFSLKYQLFLNDVSFNLGYNGILDFVMTKTYLQDIDHLLTTQKPIRYNKQNNRLYLDIDWSRVKKDEYIIIDCFRAMDPADFSKIYNDVFVKLYLTALIKRQWGQNLIKFRGVKLPGGIELNGRELYEDAEREIESIKERMTQDYELPPYDFIG